MKTHMKVLGHVSQINTERISTYINLTIKASGEMQTCMVSTVNKQVSISLDIALIVRTIYTEIL